MKVSLSELNALGVTLALDGQALRVTAKRGVLTPELKEGITAQKAELIAALHTTSMALETPVDAGPSCDAAAEARRQRVLSMLENNPGIRYALISYLDVTGDDVVLVVAIRDIGWCELAIPKAKYDPFLIMKAVQTLQ